MAVARRGKLTNRHRNTSAGMLSPLSRSSTPFLVFIILLE